MGAKGHITVDTDVVVRFKQLYALILAGTVKSFQICQAAVFAQLAIIAECDTLAQDAGITQIAVEILAALDAMGLHTADRTPALAACSKGYVSVTLAAVPVAAFTALYAAVIAEFRLGILAEIDRFEAFQAIKAVHALGAGA